MCIEQLINILKDFPKDMLVGICKDKLVCRAIGDDKFQAKLVINVGEFTEPEKKKNSVLN
jgi:hypothetical protein